MYNPGGEYLSYIKDSTIRKPRSKIVVDGKTYTGLEHLVSFPKITHETEKMIGGFPAKTCEFEIYNLDGSLNLNGKEVQVYRGLDISDTKTVWVPMGLFYADGEDVINNSTKRTIQFKGTDRTRLFDSPFTKTWDSGIIPANYTLKALANKICAVCGVTLDSSTKKNILSFQTTEKIGVPENTTNRQVISWIAELSGCIPIISRDGQYLVFTRPTVKQYQYDAGQVYDSGFYVDKRKYKTLSAEPLYGTINAVSFGHADYDDAYVYQDDTDVATNGLHEWQINDNALAENNKAELAPLVFDKIKGMKIYPFNLTDFIDDYLFDLNDGVCIKKKDGTLITTYVLGMSTTSRIRSKFKAGTQESSAADRNLAGSVKADMKSIKLSVDHINSRITAMAKESEDKFAEINLAIEGFNTRVTDLKTEVEENYVSNTTYNTYVDQTAETLKAQATSIEKITAAGYISSDECKELISAEKGNITLSVERNLKIGARNILLDSARFESFTPTGEQADVKVTPFDDPAVPSGVYSNVRFNSQINGTVDFYYSAADILQSLKKIKANTTYTLSFFARYKSGIDDITDFAPKSVISAGSATVTYDNDRCTTPKLSTAWQRYILTFKLTGTVSDFRLRFLFNNCKSTDVSAIQLSSLKLEEGNVATDWSPSAEDIDQSVKAQISMCVQKDKDNNLVSEINITSNKLTINTDNFTLDKTGKMTCTGATITGGTLTCGDESYNMTIAKARLIHTFDDEEIGRIGVAIDRSGNVSELIKGTNSVSIVAGESALFEFDSNGAINNGASNGVLSHGTDIFCGYRHFRKFGDYTDSNYKVFQCGTGIYSDKSLGVEMYDCMLNQINCAIKIKRNDNAIVSIYGVRESLNSPALTLGSTDGYLYYNGNKLAFTNKGVTSFPDAIGMSSSQSYVYVVADKNTGKIGYLSA